MPLAQLAQPFVRAEWIRSGMHPRSLDRAAARGDLIRIAPSLYAVPSLWVPLTAWERHLALARAAVRATPDAIVSHGSAAALLGLPTPPRPPERATMTLLDDRRTSEDDGWRRFHRGATPPAHVFIHRGHPYLVPSRTVVDCMRDMRPGDALAVADAALRAGLVTGRGLRQMRRHQRRWPGIAVADQIMRLGDGRRESWFESASAWVMADWALPHGIPQVIVTDSRGRFVGRVDVLWPELGVVGEADGKGKYLLDTAPRGEPTPPVAELVARALVAQGVREDRLRDLGLEVVRWDPDDLHTPLGLVERFHAAVSCADPSAVIARYSCSCCRRPLATCESPTRIAELPGA